MFTYTYYANAPINEKCSTLNSAASDLGLHCLPIPVYPHNEGKNDIQCKKKEEKKTEKIKK